MASRTYSALSTKSSFEPWSDFLQEGVKHWRIKAEDWRRSSTPHSSPRRAMGPSSNRGQVREVRESAISYESEARWIKRLVPSEARHQLWGPPPSEGHRSGDQSIYPPEAVRFELRREEESDHGLQGRFNLWVGEELDQVVGQQVFPRSPRTNQDPNEDLRHQCRPWINGSAVNVHLRDRGRDWWRADLPSTMGTRRSGRRIHPWLWGTDHWHTAGITGNCQLFLSIPRCPGPSSRTSQKQRILAIEVQLRLQGKEGKLQGKERKRLPSADTCRKDSHLSVQDMWPSRALEKGMSTSRTRANGSEFRDDHHDGRPWLRADPGVDRRTPRRRLGHDDPGGEESWKL